MVAIFYLHYVPFSIYFIIASHSGAMVFQKWLYGTFFGLALAWLDFGFILPDKREKLRVFKMTKMGLAFTILGSALFF